MFSQNQIKAIVFTETWSNFNGSKCLLEKEPLSRKELETTSNEKDSPGFLNRKHIRMVYLVSPKFTIQHERKGNTPYMDPFGLDLTHILPFFYIPTRLPANEVFDGRRWRWSSTLICLVGIQAETPMPGTFWIHLLVAGFQELHRI